MERSFSKYLLPLFSRYSNVPTLQYKRAFVNLTSTFNAVLTIPEHNYCILNTGNNLGMSALDPGGSSELLILHLQHRDQSK